MRAMKAVAMQPRIQTVRAVRPPGWEGVLVTVVRAALNMLTRTRKEVTRRTHREGSGNSQGDDHHQAWAPGTTRPGLH